MSNFEPTLSPFKKNFLEQLLILYIEFLEKTDSENDNIESIRSFLRNNRSLSEGEELLIKDPFFIMLLSMDDNQDFDSIVDDFEHRLSKFRIKSTSLCKTTSETSISQILEKYTYYHSPPKLARGSSNEIKSPSRRRTISGSGTQLETTLEELNY